jgi:hypothetical protein
LKPNQEFNMKNLLVTLIGGLTLAAVLPACAGPDGPLTEQARQSPLAGQGDVLKNMEPTAAVNRSCPPPSLVLPLDHGPRAQGTPQQNQMRKQRYEAQLRACQGIAK